MSVWYSSEKEASYFIGTMYHQGFVIENKNSQRTEKSVQALLVDQVLDEITWR